MSISSVVYSSLSTDYEMILSKSYLNDMQFDHIEFNLSGWFQRLPIFYTSKTYLKLHLSTSELFISYCKHMTFGLFICKLVCLFVCLGFGRGVGFGRGFITFFITYSPTKSPWWVFSDCLLIVCYCSHFHLFSQNNWANIL